MTQPQQLVTRSSASHPFSTVQPMSVVLSALPEHERPRERLLAIGAEALSDRELLALILRSGRSGESAVDLAGELLVRFGGVRGLAMARVEELETAAGVGPAKAAAIVAAFRLATRIGGNGAAALLGSHEDVARVAHQHLGGLRRERVIALVCDAGHHLLQVVSVSEGSIDHALVPIREILNAVLRHDGRAFALAHNHPAGDPTPSEADRAATCSVESAAATVGLRFLGHVVICPNGEWARVTAGVERPR